MFRFLVVPISFGILAFLCIYFLAPAIVPEPGVTAYAAEFILDLSNSYFETMPPIVTSYISSLNLATVALTAGILLTVVIQLVVAVGVTFIHIVKWVISLLPKGGAEEVVKDMSPIEMDPRYMDTGPGGDIFGRGLDSIDRE